MLGDETCVTLNSTFPQLERLILHSFRWETLIKFLFLKLETSPISACVGVSVCIRSVISPSVV